MAGRMIAAGRRLRADLLPVYERMRRAVAEAAAAYADISGTLWAGFTAPWSGELLIRAGDALSARYPRCTVELSDVTYNAAIAALREKRVDLLVAEPPVERRTTVSSEDRAVLPMVTAWGVSKAFHEAFFPSRTPGGRPIEHGPTAGGRQSILSLVGAGKGATVATVAAGTYHLRPGIAFVPIDDAVPVEYALMWRDGDLSTGLRALMETAVGLAPPSGRSPCGCGRSCSHGATRASDRTRSSSAAKALAYIAPAQMPSTPSAPSAAAGWPARKSAAARRSPFLSAGDS